MGDISFGRSSAWGFYGDFSGHSSAARRILAPTKSPRSHVNNGISECVALSILLIHPDRIYLLGPIIISNNVVFALGFWIGLGIGFKGFARKHGPKAGSNFRNRPNAM